MMKPHQKVCIYGIGYLVKLARAKISDTNLCGFPHKLCCFITFFYPCHRSFRYSWKNPHHMKEWQQFSWSNHSKEFTIMKDYSALQSLTKHSVCLMRNHSAAQSVPWNSVSAIILRHERIHNNEKPFSQKVATRILSDNL